MFYEKTVNKVLTKDILYIIIHRRMFTGSAILFVFIVLTQKCDNVLGTCTFWLSRENVLLSMTKVHAAARRCINDKRKKTSNVCLKWNLDYTQWLHFITSINCIGYILYSYAHVYYYCVKVYCIIIEKYRNHLVCIGT